MQDVDPLRLWASVTVALCYFAFRYWFSEARRLAWLQWKNTCDAHSKTALMNRLKADALAYAIHGKQSAIIKGLAGHALGYQDGTVAITGIEIHHGAPYPKAASATFHWKDAKGVTGSGSYQYELDEWADRLLRARTVGRAILLSQGTHELLIPYTLAVLAMWLCITALARHWP